MLRARGFLSLVFACWMISIPVMFYDLEVYHPTHGVGYVNCPYDPCPQVETDVNDVTRRVIVTQRNKYQVWPLFNQTDDRIVAQLELDNKDGEDMKIILLHASFKTENLPAGQEKFIQSQCPVTNCLLSKNNGDIAKADLVITKGGITGLVKQYPGRPEHQIIVWYMLESPLNSRPPVSANWTATYRRDSTLTAPYYKFVPNQDADFNVKSTKNYAEGKTKQVAWFVSNCNAKNGRSEYAKELAKYIDVDIYGACGKLKCSRKHSDKCSDKLNNDYKFYLSFENSHCKDYITEKFFWNGLSHDIIPIAFGARPEDYAAVAPPHSYIHTDDFQSPRHLAEYLHKLDGNDSLYNEYFHWKGTGEFIDTKFWCRLCSMLHDAHSKRIKSWYSDGKKWWNGDGVCIKSENQPISDNSNSRWASWRDKKLDMDYMRDSYHIEFSE